MAQASERMQVKITTAAYMFNCSGQVMVNTLHLNTWPTFAKKCGSGDEIRLFTNGEEYHEVLI